jgi:NitT/TauT family transport system substrate-binding protein
MPSRREFLGRTILAGALSGLWPRAVAAEPPPETARLRLIKIPVYGNCIAPLYMAEELLEAEGFTDVQYVNPKDSVASALTSGDVDIGMAFLPPLISIIDAGGPLVILAGGHVGCVELIATDRIRSLRDLKGKTVGVTLLGPLSAPYMFMATFVAHAGLDPRRDINFLARPFAQLTQLLAQGEIDALPVGPPESFEVRAKKIGRVLLNNATDRPWSQYFCCVVAGHREFVRKNPVATKRVLRAVLKSADICALEP